jgi:hypothetical protein
LEAAVLDLMLILDKCGQDIVIISCNASQEKCIIPFKEAEKRERLSLQEIFSP